jgi:hypothetical protein
MEHMERRQGVWWASYLIPIGVSLCGVILSGILWVNATQASQDIRIAVIEANAAFNRASLERIEKDVADIKRAVK